MCSSTRNQLANTKNAFQGDAPRVLFVCSGGLLRSATAAHTFSADPYKWNTRSAASNKEYGLNPVNEALLFWAELICVMDFEHIELMQSLKINFDLYSHKVVDLHIPDDYSYMQPELVDILKWHVHNYVDKETYPIFPELNM